MGFSRPLFCRGLAQNLGGLARLGKRQADKSLKSRAWCPFWVFCFTLQARKVCKHSGAKSLNSRAARTFCVFCILAGTQSVRTLRCQIAHVACGAHVLGLMRCPCLHPKCPFPLRGGQFAPFAWLCRDAKFCIQIVRFPCGVDDLRHLHSLWYSLAGTRHSLQIVQFPCGVYRL